MGISYELLCRGSHRLLKPGIGRDEAKRLQEGLSFMGLDVNPEETKALALVVLLFGMLFGSSLVALLSYIAGFSVLWLLFLGVPGILYLYLRKYPIVRAESEKRAAVGQMPEVVGYLIMSLRINPNIERSISFASRHSNGVFKKKLDGVLSDIKMGRGSAESGLLKLAGEFGKWGEFRRAVELLISSSLERNESGRQETLDKASEALLGGLSARTDKEASALQTPVMMLFTFGCLVPLVLMGVVPFMSLMGIHIGIFAIGLAYTVGLPALLYFIVRFVSSNRPATISPPGIAVEANPLPALAAALLAGVVLCLPALAWGGALGPMRYIPVLWGFAGGAGVFMILTSREGRKARRATKELEEEFRGTLHRMSALLSEGRPLESVMPRAGSKILEVASANIQNLNSGVRQAFFDKEYGSLKDTHSSTIRGVMDIMTSIVDKGSESMANIGFKLSEHMENMRKCEYAIQKSLGSVTSAMRIIAIAIAPVVGGIISSMSVVLADTVEKSGGAQMRMGAGGGALDPSLVGLIIGIYAVESAAILTIFSTNLMHGDDSVMKRFGLGIALPVSIAVFTACLWVSNSIFSGFAA